MIETTHIEGLLVFTPRKFEDDRGYFSETWNRKTFADYGIEADFVQDNHSMSVKVGTLRGLHYQAPPRAQDKLVRCTKGVILDVAVDIRVGSPTYNAWFGIELSAENRKQLLVPKGFLHGFLTRAPQTEVVYKCSDYYAPHEDGAIRFDDPEIGIEWELVSERPVLSDKDAKAPYLSEVKSPFRFEGNSA